MGITRRKFLQYSGLTAGSILLPSGMAASSEKIKAFPLHKPIREAATICPYCSCGCGLLIATGPDGHIINSEGYPDNPVNRGALDPKSVAVRQLSQSPLRLKNPLYRAPGSDKFEEKDWAWTIAEVAKRIKTTRDATFQKNKRQRRDGKPQHRHGLYGRRRQQQRGMLSGYQVEPRPGYGLSRTSGPGLTLRHCGRSGRKLGSGCDDQYLGGSEECRCDIGKTVPIVPKITRHR